MIKEAEKKPARFTAEVRRLAEEYSLTELAEKARKLVSAEFVYAAAFSAIKESLHITPFDSQILAAAYLDDDAVVELPTGEGKTVAAVFAVYYSVCKGERVHVLTFNDYLAKRDRNWMKPAYDLLGVSSSYITEDTAFFERRKAYRADVLYGTVKECGFDYLRDCLAFSEEETVACGYERVIVDEADSILIDEARIPLVASGSFAAEKDDEFEKAFAFVKTLSEGDYELSTETKTAYLTPSGSKKVETKYGIDNLYDEENGELLEKVIASLKALYILTEDEDYIVKDGGIKIVDLFTGRVAEGRTYPGYLQSAAELKHGLQVTERGTIMGELPTQFFIRLYKRISGMTGTADSARQEFDSLYGLTVKKVKPNTPSVREDLPLALYYDTESKLNAVAERVKERNGAGQPVLVGTSSIDESEALSEILKGLSIEHSLLNAKNDELEAEIISEAGLPNKVTISTNMAGRGVDIKLGGADERERSSAVSSGGLYVIGTFLAESARINDQLRGRAARQGDPGQSILFVSLDEQIMEDNKLDKLIPERRYPEKTTERITDKVVIREVERIQRISQGAMLSRRERLLKFAYIGEKHREITFSTRQKYINGESVPTVWEDNFPEMYGEACEKFGADTVNKLEQEYILAAINILWRNYLEYTNYLRDGIHLMAVGGKKPSDEYNIICEQYFETFAEQLTDAMEDGLRALLEKTPAGFKIPKPKKIMTYLIENTGEDLKRKSLMEVILGTYSDEYAEYLEEDDGYEEIYGDEEDDEAEEYEEETDEAEVAEEAPKKGFFARLFGKK